MSSHPYRQKATGTPGTLGTGTGTNPPYPVDFDGQSIYYNSPLDSINKLNDEKHASDSDLVMPKSPANPALQYSKERLSHDDNYISEAQSPTIQQVKDDSGEDSFSSISSSGDTRSPFHGTVAYPPFNILTPPPVFAKGARSPSSNAVSATSSVTNLNSNHPSHHSTSLSKSEPVLPLVDTSSHVRSTSSTSSFFYDRNDSIVDFNQNIIQQHLGNSSSHLLPRMKTIELYGKNAKKSNDPTVLFQYAQYMLQTALLLDANNSAPASDHGSNGATPNHSPNNTPKKDHQKTKSGSSFESHIGDPESEAKLKKSLLKEAVHYLRKLSDKGYVEAQYLLGDAFSSGALGKVDNKEAFSLFQAAAKHGHIEGAYRTSYCYEEGLGTGRDARKAVDYLKMAASRNHPSSMYKLGVYSFYGRMGLQNNIDTKKMGIKWLTRASNVANELIAAAPYELGKIYFYGFEDIVIADKEYALKLYSQAAALGHIESAAILGKCYEIGEIVPQDSNLSIHYYTQAALGGDAESMLAMCAWYLVGNDPYLPKDDNEAFEWAKRAALCKLPKAQFALANFYDKGIGCNKDSTEAQKWYKIGAEYGDEKCLGRVTDKEFVAKVSKKLKKKRPAVTAEDPLQSKNSSQEKDCKIM